MSPHRPSCARVLAALFLLSVIALPSRAFADPLETDAPRWIGAGDGTWSEPIPKLAGMVAVYDPVREHVVAVAPDPANGTLDLLWSTPAAGTPVWTRTLTAGTAPSLRTYFTLTYDPVRDRVLLYGGGAYLGGWVYYADVWALTLGDTPTWTHLVPAGTPPVGRLQHTAVYDPVRDRLVVFGGNDGSGTGYRNDVWALSLSGAPAWTQLAPSGTPPVGRASASLVYDLSRDRVVLFGGDGWGSPYRSDVWSLTLAGTPAWTALLPAAGPHGRDQQSAIYDPVGDRMIVFGGFSYAAGVSTFYSDVWALSSGATPAWTQLTQNGTTPVARYGASAMYDAAHRALLVCGGAWLNVTRQDAIDLWKLPLPSASQWTLLLPDCIAPPGRHGHSTIYDPAYDRLVVFGGTDGSTFTNEVWTLSLGSGPTWTHVTPSGTPPDGRAWHTAVFDPVRKRMLVYGGYRYVDGSGQNFGDVWALSLTSAPAWTQLAPAGDTPVARAYHSAIYDPGHDRMVVFGGNSLWDYVWSLSLAGTPTWATIPSASGFGNSVRYYHSAVYDAAHDRMVVFGGHDGMGAKNDVWAMSLGDTSSWTNITPAWGAAPVPRFRHSAMYDPVRDRMIVFGGDDYYIQRNDTWALPFSAAPTWVELAPAGAMPAGRAYTTATLDPLRDRMLVFGGVRTVTTNLSDTQALAWGPTLWFGDYFPLRLGLSWTLQNVNNAGDQRTRLVFDSLRYEGHGAFRIGTPAGHQVVGRVGRAVDLYAMTDGGVEQDLATDIRFGTWNDGSAIAVCMGAACDSSIVRVWPRIDPALRAPFALDAFGDLMLMAAYDRNQPPNAINAIVESNLPAGVAPPTGGITSLEWYQRGVGLVATRDVQAAIGTMGDLYVLVSSAGVDGAGGPHAHAGLAPPVPNPASGRVVLAFTLGAPGNASLDIFDVGGRRVRRLLDGVRPAGPGTAVWDGRDETGAPVKAGIYFARFDAPGTRALRKVVRLQ